MKRAVDYASMAAAYGFPNLIKPSIPLSERGRTWLEGLRRDGIIKLGGEEFREAADYLLREYFDKLEKSPTHDLDGSHFGDPRLWTRDVNVARYRDFGLKMTCEISLLDDKLKALFRNADIMGMLYNYYRRQPYYRNQPRIQHTDVSPESNVQGGNAYHTDRYHQVSAMLLCSDVTEEQTHMEYMVGSHNRSFLSSDIEMGREACEKLIRERHYRTYSLVGKRGTFFVYDTSAIHRRHLLPNSQRKVLIWTVTTGHHLEPFHESTSRWPELKAEPWFVQRFFDKLG